jgi:hypothetical protein
VKLYYCRPCYLHDRVSIRYADKTPIMPCPHSGSEREDCKRVEWCTRNWYCVVCHNTGRTTILYAGSPVEVQGVNCEFGHHAWAETEESKYVMRSMPNRFRSVSA